ncbi:hypothetical protein BT93_C2241 [Corymbia citriodora subsp. variegata]|nr:hypothetical protein BT93_C2241 [Corymbia citriodora subsp. variegata]
MERPGGKSLSLDGGSSSSSKRDYDVFLSFRGPDTRLTITDSLYEAMILAGIRVFKDDEELRVGEEIKGELLAAISNSKIYIPIFSKDYASSKWCLRELTYMVECKKRSEKVFLPIFCEVEASDVKLKTGSYGKALQKHERESGEDVAKWEEALKEVAKIKGWNLKDYRQHKLTALVLEEVFRKLRRPTQRNWHDDLVGVHDQMEGVMKLLSQGTSGVRFVEMQFDHALQLFSKHSFERDSPPHDYSNISSEIVRITGRLPLALEVIGSLLHSKSMTTWKDTLKKLKKVPNEDVQKKLSISYHELEYEQQQIFLDIACYFVGEERIPAYYMWKACEYFPRTGLRVLIHQSLIKIIENDKLWMHDQLKDLGREIVRKECLQVPAKRSRLWCPRVASDVIQNNLGTDNIVALNLIGLANAHDFTSGEISRLPSLRFLELDGGNFVGDFKNLLSNLKWLSWRNCPSNLHAKGLCLRNLAILKISESNITEDWNGWGPCTVNDNLKVIYLTSCYSLRRTPDFSKCMNLKRLVLVNCSVLAEINGSIGQLGCLKYLEIYKEERVTWMPCAPPEFDDFAGPLIPASIGGLKSLSMLKMENLDDVIELPHSIGELLGLKHLSLHGCTQLNKLPYSIGELRSLLCLDLSSTSIIRLPDSIGRLETLLKIDLSRTLIAELPGSIGNLRQLKFMCLDGTKIRELPKNIWTLENLEELIAKGCRNLEGEIPPEIVGLSQLKILNLSRSKISSLPMTISRLYSLQELVLSDCKRLQLLPDLPTSLAKLELSSSSLQAIPDLSNLTNLHHLDISNCSFDFAFLKTTQGQVSNPNLEGLGRLNELQILRLVLFDSNLPPTDLGSLCQLRSLEITCPDPRSLTQLPSNLEVLSLEDVKTPIEWPMFSDLGNLSELKLFGCRLREIEFDNVLGQLENLQRLQVRKCESLVKLSNLSSLKELRVLSVEYCPQLTEIESQPSLTGDCPSSERPIPDSLKLEKLRSLRVYYCESVRKLPDMPKACHVPRLIVEIIVP